MVLRCGWMLGFWEGRVLQLPGFGIGRWCATSEDHLGCFEGVVSPSFMCHNAFKVWLVQAIAI